MTRRNRSYEPRRHLPKAKSELELLQRYAGLMAAKFAGRRNRRDVGPLGTFTWMLEIECARDLGTLNGRDQVAVGYHAHEMNGVPSLMYKDGLCGCCHAKPATWRVGIDREFCFDFVCPDCVEVTRVRLMREAGLNLALIG